VYSTRRRRTKTSMNGEALCLAGTHDKLGLPKGYTLGLHHRPKAWRKALFYRRPCRRAFRKVRWSRSRGVEAIGRDPRARRRGPLPRSAWGSGTDDVPGDNADGPTFKPEVASEA
jgi:hypothetical protein